ncbi:MAG: endolytic transglycosylase MltG [Chitinophagales bacterium]|nr:endolytic transglycosylase MltG [Chitinophagales bacterium]MDW8418371.1 endolytic transglycosylase MltG [Chitinophagales bacterium]
MWRVIIWLLLLATLAGAALVYAVFLMPNTTNRKSVVIRIPTGARFEYVLHELRKHGVLRSEQTFEWVARYKNYPAYIKPGQYQISPRTNNRKLVNMLKGGLQLPVKLVINNIRTKEEFAGLIGHTLELDSATVMLHLNDTAFCNSYQRTTENILGFFMADTYEFYWDRKHTDMQKIMDVMQEVNRQFWNEERRSKAANINLTPSEVVILASIVEKEVFHDSEMPTIAGVYLNRLKIGMLLQADPTLKFATRDLDARRVTNRHRNYDSPYNTYLYPGLPPGPICIPRKNAIDAVLNAQQHNYLYFCANPDMSGYSVFSENYEQHKKVAAMYQKKLNAMNIY